MILTGWALSPSAARARAWLGGRFDAGRAGLDQVGATMGKTGLVLGTQVVAIRWAIVALGVLAAALTWPLTPGNVVTWTLVVLLLLTVFELLWRRPAVPAKPAPAKSAPAKSAPAKSAPATVAPAKSAAKKSSTASKSSRASK
jgi:hypothetical protein